MNVSVLASEPEDVKAFELRFMKDDSPKRRIWDGYRHLTTLFRGFSGRNDNLTLTIGVTEFSDREWRQP